MRSGLMRWGLILLLSPFLLASSKCSDSSDDDSPPPPVFPVGGLAPDFTLTDVNPNSATHNADVSPGDYLTTVSAWYFAPAT